MSTSVLTPLYDDLWTSIHAIRVSFRSHTKTADVLNGFWTLEDLLHRLVAITDDCPGDAIPLMKANYPSLVREIIDVLQSASKLRYKRLPAVGKSCDAINSRLIELEQIKQRYRVKAAGA